jgi:membrane fusion protein (multidrug efflux system)
VGVTRDQKGLPVALVVTPAGQVERRPIVTDRTVGDAWLVTAGLKPGEQVIVEGVQKVRPGAPVKAIPAGGAKDQARK